MRAALRRWWSSLARRERIATGSAAALALAAMFFLLAIEPAWRARARLDAELPRLRAAAAEIDALGLEAKRLRGRGLALESGAQTRAALARLLAERNIGGAEIRDGDERRLLLTVRRADAAAFLAWMKEASSELPLRVVSARISRAGPGLVDADMALAPAGQK